MAAYKFEVDPKLTPAGPANIFGASVGPSSAQGPTTVWGLRFWAFKTLKKGFRGLKSAVP